MSAENPSPESEVTPGSEPIAGDKVESGASQASGQPERDARSTPDIFSPDEVNELTREYVPQPVEGITKLFNSAGDTIHGDASVQSFDFRNPSFLSEKEINQVRSRNEKFAFYLGQSLSMELRMSVDFAVKNLAVLQYGEFTQSIASPAHVSLFKINEISGVGILEMGAVLALAMVDRSLGGRGVAVKEPRLLTAIESTMMDDLSQVIVDEWMHQWSDYLKLSGKVIGQETTGRFLQTAAPDSAILVLTLEATLGEVKEDLKIGIPYYSITPILTQIAEHTRNADKAPSNSETHSWRTTYDGISVKANSEWNVKSTTVKDLIEMEPGDFIQLSPTILKHTLLRIAGKDCFIGEFGKNEEGVAIKITEKL
jgi:flagellar motor switch protein FliM